MLAFGTPYKILRVVPVRGDHDTLMKADVAVFWKATETAYKAFFNLEPKQARYPRLTIYAASNMCDRVHHVRKRKELRKHNSLNAERSARQMKVYRIVYDDNGKVINVGVISAANECDAINTYCNGADRPREGCHYVIESPGAISRGRMSKHLQDGKCFKVKKSKHGLIAEPYEH